MLALRHLPVQITILLLCTFLGKGTLLATIFLLFLLLAQILHCEVKHLRVVDGLDAGPDLLNISTRLLVLDVRFNILRLDREERPGALLGVGRPRPVLSCLCEA